MSWSKSKTNSKFVSVKKKEDAFSTIRNTVIYDVENFDLVLILEANSGKESNMDQELANCNNNLQ